MKLIVAMIIKNEESCIETALSSLQGVDEIIIVDTGSTDDTIEIAKKYTNKIYTDYKWNDNFAEARNHVLSKCDKDAWVLSFDADDVLITEVDKIKQFINGLNDDIKAINCNFDSKTNIHYFPTLFKNTGEIYWKGVAHNYLHGNIKSINSDIIIQRGSSDTHKKNPDRTLNILQKTIDKNPNQPRELFYLAREYYYKKDYETAIKYYELYLKIAWWKPEIAEAYLMKSRCLWFLQRGQEARNTCLKAIQTNPDFKEALFFMGEMHYEPMKSQWLRFSEVAKNNEVLFKRVLNPKLDAEKIKELWALDKTANNVVKKLLPKNSTILELGSGHGTEILSKDYTMFSIEQNQAWLNKFNSTYIYAPIKNNWYDLEALKQLPKDYDFIIVDGPVGPDSRKNFVLNFVLFKQDVPILIDDVNRAEDLKGLNMLVEKTKRNYTIYKGENKQFAIVYPKLNYDLNMFINCTDRGVEQDIKIFEQCYNSFIDKFGKTYNKFTIYLDPNPKDDKNLYLEKLNKYANIVITESLADGYKQSVIGSTSEFIFQLEFDWLFNDNIKHTMYDILALLKKNNLSHLRFNKRSNTVAGWDKNIIEHKDFIYYCETNNVSNNPHIIKRDNYLNIIELINYNIKGSKGIEEELNKHNMKSYIYGQLNYPNTITHLGG